MMAVACPVDLDTLKLRAEIQSVYQRVATEPFGDFHFHRGPGYAAEMLEYDADALVLPAENTASFVPWRCRSIPAASTSSSRNGVLNLTPDKRQAFGEVFRILKPGGSSCMATS